MCGGFCHIVIKDVNFCVNNIVYLLDVQDNFFQMCKIIFFQIWFEVKCILQDFGFQLKLLGPRHYMVTICAGFFCSLFVPENVYA